MLVPEMVILVVFPAYQGLGVMDVMAIGVGQTTPAWQIAGQDRKRQAKRRHMKKDAHRPGNFRMGHRLIQSHATTVRPC
jgi:hypothetical protein